MIARAKAEKEQLIPALRLWWEEIYKQPSMGNPLFEQHTPADIMKHLIMKALDKGATVSLEDDGMLNFHWIGQKAPAKPNAQPRTTGDPVVDRWERLIAAGVNPFAEDVKAVIGEE
jgi:hypothetical protein